MLETTGNCDNDDKADDDDDDDNDDNDDVQVVAARSMVRNAARALDSR